MILPALPAVLPVPPQRRSILPAKPLTPLRAVNRISQQITGRPYLSWSQIATMRSCPKKFELLYVQHVPPDHLASSLLFGGAMHSAIELFFRCRMEGLEITPQALFSQYKDSFRRQCADHPDTPVKFNKGEDHDVLDQLATRMIESFLASPAAEMNGEILGIEEQLQVVLHPELPDLLARVDLVLQQEDALHVIDFKTSRSRWNEQKAKESGEQLLLYATTVSRMSGELSLPVKLQFAVLTKAKKPLVQMLPVPFETSAVEQLTENVSAVWQAIQSQNFYPAPSPQSCCTCAFKSRCPVFAR